MTESKVAVDAVGPYASDRPLGPLSAAVVASLAFHGMIVWGLTEVRIAGPSKAEAVSLDILESIKAPPPEPPKPEPPKPEPPKAPPVKKEKLIAKVDPPPPNQELPPPPNTEQPKQEKPAPVFVGISMSSTTTAGGFAAPVGNTLYGATPRTAPMPDDVKPYAAKKYVAPHLVHEMPSVVNANACKNHFPTPEQAKREAIEGQVVLRVSIDETGKVTGVKVVKGLGYGLDELAVAEMKICPFRPAKVNGEPVATEITYQYTFEWE